MKHITATDTLELSVPERIQLVEDIWDTIANEPEVVQLSDEENKIIYLFKNDAIFVLAVLHGKRSTALLKNRIDCI